MFITVVPKPTVYLICSIDQTSPYGPDDHEYVESSTLHCIDSTWEIPSPDPSLSTDDSAIFGPETWSIGSIFAILRDLHNCHHQFDEFSEVAASIWVSAGSGP